MTELQKKGFGEQRYLCFTLGEEEYAIPLLSVREVIAMPEVTPIPQVPSYFLGIMNLRGQVLSILDLRTKLGIKSKKGNETTVIICDLGQISIGVVVDSVNSVLAPKEGEISDETEFKSHKFAQFIVAVHRREKHLILFLDISKALNLDDLGAINRGHKAA